MGECEPTPPWCKVKTFKLEGTQTYHGTSSVYDGFYVHNGTYNHHPVYMNTNRHRMGLTVSLLWSSADNEWLLRSGYGELGTKQPKVRFTARNVPNCDPAKKHWKFHLDKYDKYGDVVSTTAIPALKLKFTFIN